MENCRPAIVAVGYNRPAALRRLLNSIGNAAFDSNDVTLIVSIDHSDAQADVRAVADDFEWTHGEKLVRCMETRQGLRKHILACGDLAEAYGAAIILEDDLIVAPGFYRYVCAALAFYGDEKALAGVSLYSHAWNGYADVPFTPEQNGFDTYLGQYSITWGQCWTRAQWRRFRHWYAQNDGDITRLYGRMPADITTWPNTSWGKYFVGYLLDNDLCYVIPYVSLSTNCEEVGQHAAGGSDAHQVALLRGADKRYAFAPIDRAVRYDLFFERVGLDLSAYGVGSADVCVDLHGQKSGTDGRRYLLSCKTYALPVLYSFGMRMRPIEANIEYGIPGNDIFLYDAANGLPAPSFENGERRLTYELYRFGWRRLLPYSLKTMLLKLLGRVRRRFGGR